MDIEIQKKLIHAQNSKAQIKQQELNVLKLKIQLMQIVCSTFYNIQHRCLFKYIASLTLQNIKLKQKDSNSQEKYDIKQDDLSIFQNYLSLLIDLRQGYFLTTYEIFQKKETKKDKRITCYKLNTDGFFKIIRKILTELQIKIQKIKKFYADTKNKQIKQGTSNMEQKRVNKRCKQCHAIQDDYARQFGFQFCLTCKCTEFQDVAIIQQQKQRIQKLTQIISIVFTKMKNIQQGQNKLENKIKENKEIQKSLNIKQIDRFLLPHQTYLRKQGEKVQISLDFKTIKEAQKKHSPLTEYQRVKQMIQSRQNRQRSRQKRIQQEGRPKQNIKTF